MVLRLFGFVLIRFCILRSFRRILRVGRDELRHADELVHGDAFRADVRVDRSVGHGGGDHVRKPVIPPQDIRIILSRLARTSFAHRRKKMFKQAAAVFGADVIAAAMADASVDPDIRAERVTVDQFIRMAEFIAAHTQDPPETAQDAEADENEFEQP